MSGSGTEPVEILVPLATVEHESVLFEPRSLRYHPPARVREHSHLPQLSVKLLFLQQESSDRHRPKVGRGARYYKPSDRSHRLAILPPYEDPLSGFTSR